MGLSNLCNISEMSISEKVEHNLISFFDWGFVEKGGYINIDVNTSGAYVDNRSILHRVSDLRNTGIAYYQGPENWVYETDTVSTPAPYPVPLIYVNSVLDLTPIINYRDGRVTPSIATTTASVVKAKFSYKWVNFTSARRAPYRRQIQYRQTRTDLNNGEYKIPPEIRIPLPTVIIDVPPISRSKPYSIDRFGARSYYHNITCYVIGESASDVVKICDFISSQQGRVIPTFDPVSVASSGDFPLNFNGTSNSAKNHDQLVTDYRWANINIELAESIWSGYLTENIYQAIVRINTETTACLNC